MLPKGRVRTSFMLAFRLAINMYVEGARVWETKGRPKSPNLRGFFCEKIAREHDYSYCRDQGLWHNSGILSLVSSLELPGKTFIDFIASLISKLQSNQQ